MLLYEEIGDLLVLDIGGATTDVHSVTAGSDEIAQLLTAPEPFNKRTVEGDLGLFVNAHHLVEQIGEAKFRESWGWMSPPLCATTSRFRKCAEQFMPDHAGCA